MSSTQQPNVTLVADDPEFRITLHDHPSPASDRVIVTFGTLPSGLADRGFGTDFALKNGFSTIHVAQRKQSSYQGLSLDQFTHAVVPALAGRQAVTYGTSLGGYAAVYYGGIIDAEIVCAAPRLSVLPELGRPLSRTAACLHLPLDQTPCTTRRVSFIYDPHQASEAHLMDRYLRPMYPDAVHHVFPFFGHKILESLARTIRLQSLIAPLLKGESVSIEADGTGNAIWNANRARHALKAGEIAEALQHGHRSIAIAPTSDGVGALARCLQRTGDHAAAASVLDALRADPQAMRRIHGHVLREMERAAGLTAVATG